MVEIEVSDKDVETIKEELLDNLTEFEVCASLELDAGFGDPVNDIYLAYFNKDYELFGKLIHEAVRRTYDNEKEDEARSKLEQEQRERVNGEYYDG